MNLMKLIKESIKRTWIVKELKKNLKKKKRIFPGSSNYWEQRYVSGKNSGSGSYGRLAEFKAEILNSFVERENIQSVIEYGFGDGNQLGLANFPTYVGFEVSEQAIEMCRQKFSMDTSKKFYSILDDNWNHFNAELTLSLDVLYHLIEDDVFNVYMKRLFASSTKFVIIYSSNYDDQIAAHVRCRKFTNWVNDYASDCWELLVKIDNRYPFDSNDPHNSSMADFYIYKRV